MIRTLLGNIKDGRLARLPYLGYSILLAVIMIVAMFGIVAVIAGAETIIGGDLQAAQQILRENFSGIFVVFMMFFALTLVFAGANIAAKRVRDMGLPGWPVVLGFAVVVGVISGMVSQNVGNGLSTLGWLALLLVPGGMFKESTK